MVSDSLVNGLCMARKPKKKLVSPYIELGAADDDDLEINEMKVEKVREEELNDDDVDDVDDDDDEEYEEAMLEAGSASSSLRSIDWTPIFECVWISEDQQTYII